MALVTFQDLPSTSTPINATNLNKIQESNVYSTNEVEIGKWTNNKPLYRKVIEYTSGLASNTTKNIATITNASEIIIKQAYLKSTTGLFYPLNMVGYNGNTTDKVYVYTESGTIKCYSTGGWGSSIWKLIVIVEYTKTTD
jgi:hypothetical protein